MSICKLDFGVFLFFLLEIRIQMEFQTETFGLNVHMHEGFDCDDVHLELRNLVKDYGLIVGLISTPNGLFTFESIPMPSDLNE
jgi:hypothetical protein